MATKAGAGRQAGQHRTDGGYEAYAPGKLELAARHFKWDLFQLSFCSRFIAAVFAFLVFCAAAATAHFGAVPDAAFLEHTWASWAIDDFLKSSKQAHVVFLGSSLVLVPLAGVDANLLGRRLDGSQHHRSVYFEESFKQASGCSIRTFNFALPGEMPSDAYFIADFLLHHGKKPDVVVYGIGPRDFMDNILPCPAATDPFSKLTRFGDVSPMLMRVMPGWLDRLNFKLGQCLYLYGIKEDLAAQAGAALAKICDFWLPVPQGEHSFSVQERRVLLPLYKTSELAVGDAYFRPGANEPFADNVNEYRKRYATVKWDTFTTQMRFFAELLDIAKARGIKMVIVAMPITKINRCLIKDYAWDAYRHSVHVLAGAKGATFIDLQDGGCFKLSDFMDTVHLNSSGGKKMLDILTSCLSKDTGVRNALGLSSGSVY